MNLPMFKEKIPMVFLFSQWIVITLPDSLLHLITPPLSRAPCRKGATTKWLQTTDQLISACSDNPLRFWHKVCSRAIWKTQT